MVFCLLFILNIWEIMKPRISLFIKNFGRNTSSSIPDAPEEPAEPAKLKVDKKSLFAKDPNISANDLDEENHNASHPERQRDMYISVGSAEGTSNLLSPLSLPVQSPLLSPGSSEQASSARASMLRPRFSEMSKKAILRSSRSSNENKNISFSEKLGL